MAVTHCSDFGGCAGVASELVQDTIRSFEHSLGCAEAMSSKKVEKCSATREGAPIPTTKLFLVLIP
jgi:hypothetical protein